MAAEAEKILGIVLVSAAHDRVHAALTMAAGAAALGRAVTVFATNAGCRALCADWSGVDDVGRDAVIRRRGVAGLGELREAAREMGVRMMACESGLKAEAIETGMLWDGVEHGGMAEFLEATRQGQLIAF